jgi:FKBP-type peptidyl-prolyl cis-trans isomerase 2
MVLQNGDFVKINYIGKIKESGKVFDTTVEQVAKENKIYDEKIQFKAVPIVIGAGHVIKGLDEALIGTEVGEKKIIEIPPVKGYGERDPKLVKVVPLKDFKKQGLTPVPGMRIEAEGRIGKVQSVGAGRVRVDFNYELAGKVLEYEVNVEEKTNKLEEKIRLLLELHFPYANPNDHEVKLENSKAVIILSDIAKIKQEALLAKHYVARDIFKFLNIKEVEFREVFKKPEAQSGEKKD